MAEPTPSEKSKTVNTKRWIIENIISLALALFIVFMIRSSIIEAFKIPSGSMIPTLLVGDHIFVNKFSYGFKIPFSDDFTGSPIYVFKREPPKRGDVIVFRYPKDESLHYIKRVVGIGGDTIEIRNKMVYINQNLIKRDLYQGADTEKIFKSFKDGKYSPANLDLYLEKLDSAEHFMMLDKNSYMGPENFGPITVPQDHLFVMGDNRDYSNDSRFWGFVPMRNVKGRAMVIWLSLWISFSDDQYYFRPERIGTVLR